MVEVIVELNNMQKHQVKHNLYNLNNICMCDKCNALIQFDEKDINRERIVPRVGCPCGSSVQLHSKYKMK